MKPYSTNATEKYIAAPNVPEIKSAYLGVWVSMNDKVIWTYSPDGRSIVGYTVIKKAVSK